MYLTLSRNSHVFDPKMDLAFPLVDQLFEQVFPKGQVMQPSSRPLSYETYMTELSGTRSLVVRFDVPGAQADELQVEYEEATGKVSVEYERKQPAGCASTPTGVGVVYGKYKISVPVPEIDPSSFTAKLGGGILEVRAAVMNKHTPVTRKIKVT